MCSSLPAGPRQHPVGHPRRSRAGSGVRPWLAALALLVSSATASGAPAAAAPRATCEVPGATPGVVLTRTFSPARLVTLHLVYRSKPRVHRRLARFVTNRLLVVDDGAGRLTVLRASSRNRVAVPVRPGAVNRIAVMLDSRRDRVVVHANGRPGVVRRMRIVPERQVRLDPRAAPAVVGARVRVAGGPGVRVLSLGGAPSALSARACPATAPASPAGACGSSAACTTILIPGVSYSGPPDGAAVRTPTEVLAQVDDPSRVSRVEFGVDGVVRAVRTAPPYSWTIDPLEYAVGRHELRMAVTSAQGGTSQVVRTYRLTTARFFKPESVWNSPLPAGAPLDPSSSSVVQDLVQQVGAAQPWLNTDAYSAPIYTVPAGLRRIPVTYDRSGVSPHPLVLDAFSSVPVPPDAKPAAGTDGHMVVWQPSTDTMWDFWVMHGQGDAWSASWGGKLEGVSGSEGVMRSPSGATASGLPLAAGMILLDEVRRGRIDHALAIGILGVRSEVFNPPANRTDGGGGNSQPPMGARFRLDPALDVPALGLPPLVRMMAEAAQRYGVIVRDKSGAVVFYGEDPTPTGSKNVYQAALGGTGLGAAMSAFPWSHLQLIRMDLRCCWQE